MVFLPLGTHGTPLPVRLGSALVSRAVCERAPRCGPSAPLPWVSLCIFTVEVVIFVEYFTHFYEGVTQQPERSWSHHPHCAHALGGLQQSSALQCPLRAAATAGPGTAAAGLHPPEADGLVSGLRDRRADSLCVFSVDVLILRQVLKDKMADGLKSS